MRWSGVWVEAKDRYSDFFGYCVVVLLCQPNAGPEFATNAMYSYARDQVFLLRFSLLLYSVLASRLFRWSLFSWDESALGLTSHPFIYAPRRGSTC
jgi:hypothetical protein